MKTAMILFVTAATTFVVNLRGDVFYWNTNGHFYRPVSTPENVSWTTASNAAVAAGGYLVTITTAEESAFVYSLIATNDAMWNLVGSGHGPWIGAFQLPGSQEPAGGWTWVAGETFAFANWRLGEPSNAGGIEGFAHIIGTNQPTSRSPFWNDLPDAGTPGGVRSYIIEYDSAPTTDVSIFGAVEIRWFGQPNTSYQVQSRSPLTPTNWTNFGPPVQGYGTNLSVFDSTTGATSRFYQVVILP